MLTKHQEQLAKLLAVPLVPQKTPQWYKLREQMITASDFAQALGEGKFGTQKDLIKKKCLPQDDSAFKSGTNPFFKWGNLFEPVACDLYSKMHKNIKIHEFGLIQHPKYKYFGASPDGITNDGVMLEIKCPFKRKIVKGGDVPKQYYYQIQGQLDVCELDECDYFECEFERHSEQDAFDEIDGEVCIQRWRGALIDYGDGEYGHVEYSDIFSPYSKAYDHLSRWVENHMIGSGPGNVYYWSLAVFNEKRVFRDKKWVDEKLVELGNVWDEILFYRENPDKIQLGLDKTLVIDTEEAYPKTKKQTSQKGQAISGYSFRDIEN